MNEPCAKITLDVQQASTSTFVAVKRGDIGRKIVITLSDGGFPYDIAADCYAVLTGTKPDGNILYNHCDIVGNTIVYEITEQTTASAGRMKAEVKLYGADDILVTSATFRIIIDGTVYTDSQVESSSEFSALTQLISQVVEIIRKYSDVTTVTKTSELINDSGFITNAVSDLVNYYTKTDIGNLLSNIPKFRISAVSVLPTEDISETTIYLLSGGACSDLYTEYLRVDGKWEILGSQRVDLTGYATEEWVEQKLEKHSGGNVDYVGVEPAEDDIPQVYLTGVDGVAAPTTKADGEVNFKLHYVSKSEEFTAYCTLKLQGDSSASTSYKKKNYTVKMFSDSAHESKLKKEFRDWGFSTNKYILKANWIDATHARQMVAYDIWSKIVQTREGYADSVEATLPNQGTSDGFPVIVYINDTYYGIYNWILPKSDTLFGVDEDDANQFVLYGQLNTDGTYRKTANNFRALWSGVDVDNWEIEVGTNSDIVKTALNDFIGFVMTATDEEFHTSLNNYCDVNALIDDYLFEYYICGLDALAQNMILICRDGKKFTLGVWDRDSTFGLWWNGAAMVSKTYRCPEDYQERFSLLWARLEGTFYNELKTRKAELRADGAPLSFGNIVGTFDKFVHKIGDDRYDENNAVYAQPSKNIATKQQFREYVRDRLAYVDSCVDSFGTVIKCADISLSESTVKITEGNHTLTANLVPSATTQEIVWSSDDESVLTVENGVITPVAIGSANVKATCGQYSAICSVTVSSILEVPCTGIALSASELIFAAEGTQTLTATVTPDGCTDEITWESDNTSVATVENGVVTAAANGGATITAYCGEYSASCSVSVSGVGEAVECTGITLSEDNIVFDSGVSITITATLEPENSTDIIVWASSNEQVAIVKDGLITPIGNGECVITATAGSVSAHCTVTVNEFMSWSDTKEYNISNTGEIVSGDCYVSSLFALDCGYQYKVEATEDYNYLRGASYSEDGTFVKRYSEVRDAPMFINVYDGAEKVRLALTTSKTNPEDRKVNIEQVGIWSTGGMGLNRTTGEITSGSDRVTLPKIPVEAGATYRITNINSGTATWFGFVEYDEDGAFIKFGEDKNAYEKKMEPNTAYIRAKAYSSNDLNGNVEITKVG